MFLAMKASDDQADLVFSGVFSIVWIGEAVVTLQIKLLGGSMYVQQAKLTPYHGILTTYQFFYAVGVYHRLHALSAGDRIDAVGNWPTHDCSNSSLHCIGGMVFGSRRQYPGRLRCGQEQGILKCIPLVRVLYRPWLPLFY